MLSLYEANSGKNFTCHWQAISSVSNEYHFLLHLSQFESAAPEEEVRKLHQGVLTLININPFISVVGDVSVVLYVGKAWMGYHSP